jgi:hypothetical protein
LARWAATRNPDRAYWVARTCVLANDFEGGIDWQKVVELAETAVEVSPKDLRFQAMLTAARLRAGHVQAGPAPSAAADASVDTAAEDGRLRLERLVRRRLGAS